MAKTFDFIDFLDCLRPYLDALAVVKCALLGIDQAREDDLPRLASTMAFHLDLIEDLCTKALNQYRRG